MILGQDLVTQTNWIDANERVDIHSFIHSLFLSLPILIIFHIRQNKTSKTTSVFSIIPFSSLSFTHVH
jgi:hypothetical protein